MANAKSTKRALLLSVLSLVVCVTMLIGSTFAWFTDSATTGVNTIVAGNLDIVLSSGKVENDAISYEEVTKDTLLFNNKALWEPGYTEVAYLKVENVGTLALKALLTVNFSKQVAGTNVFDEEFKLSDYLMYDLVEIKEGEFYATREAARDAAKANAVKIATEQNEIYLDADADALYYALVVYMPEDVDNNANHKTGTTAPSINLGVTLLATQNTVESDSFDNQYDKKAEYPSSIENNEGLYEALASSDNVTIKGGNYTLPLEVPANKTLNVEGGDYISDSEQGSKPAFTVGDNSTLVISASDLVATHHNTAIQAQAGSNTTIDNGTYASSNIQVFQIAGNGQDESKFTINNGSIKGSAGIWCDDTNAIITINGGNFDVWALVMGDHVPTTPVSITGGTFDISGSFDAGQNTPFVITGGTFNLDPTQYVDTNAYQVVEDAGWYTVTAK